MNRKNIILIGMSGAGKSTLGVILAKLCGMDFIDTDIVIQKREGRRLQDIIDSDGNERFISIEQSAVLSLEPSGFVIATGGSVVYSDTAMLHLKNLGTVVYLKVPCENLEKRVTNIDTRGIVFRCGGNFRDVYAERVPLYEKYADITMDCSRDDIEKNARKIKEIIFSSDFSE